MATFSRTVDSRTANTSPFYSKQLRTFALMALVTLFTVLLLLVFLMPFGNMTMVALRSQQNLSQTATDPIYPTEARLFKHNGVDYPLYKVPLPSAEEVKEVKELGLAPEGKTRVKAFFIDPANPDAGLIEWQGNWRTLEALQVFTPRWQNFPEAWTRSDFPTLFRNTLIIALTGVVGTLLSCICVAYAFARFPIPGKNILFIILIGTIILPSQVTLIPTYAFFATIKWTGTWLPLIVPHFFANAYNVFLLRQYFLTLPRDLDEAAMIDGAGPFRVLTSVIIPQSWAAIIAVGVFHFVFAWNDFFGPLLYLLGKPELYPISVGIQIFNFQFGPQPELVQATSLMALVLPVIIFFLAQRVFMRGIVITGVEK